MSCAASTILANAVAQGYESLDERMLWLCAAGVLSTNTGLTAQQALAGAASAGYYKIPPGMLDETILALCT